MPTSHIPKWLSVSTQSTPHAGCLELQGAQCKSIQGVMASLLPGTDHQEVSLSNGFLHVLFSAF
jgi:hypothetical protein